MQFFNEPIPSVEEGLAAGMVGGGTGRKVGTTIVKFRKSAAVAALISAPLLTVGSMTAAQASTQHFRPVPSARGHVALAGPLQYADFAAFASQRGWISYTNFESNAAHSSVWNISSATSLTFTSGSSTYAHTMQVTSMTALSPVVSSFRGTGYYNGNTATKWTIHGYVDFARVSFRIYYTAGPDAGYHLRASGHIAPNGSVFGGATDSNGNHLGLSMPAGSAFSVIQLVARVT